MKKSLLALAVLGVFASAASAQSSVTLSGSVDAGLRRVGTATGHDWRMQGSQSGYNAFTIAGSEDLGGGMRAFFALNHRFAIQNGTGNGTTYAAGIDPFWRNTEVGLSGAFGDVRLGRILVPIQVVSGTFDPFLTGTVGTVFTNSIAATARATNTIYYRSPTMGGLSVHASISAAEGQNQAGNGTTGLGEIGNPGAQGYFARTVDLNRERPMGFNARYTAGPLRLAAGYDRNTAGMKTAGVYGAYNFGVFTLLGAFEKGDNFTSAAAAALAEDIKTFSLGVTAPFGPVLIRAGYLNIDSDLVNRDAKKMGFGGDYNLSKRTNLYATVGKWSGNRISVANKKAQFDLGVTHRF